MEAGHPLHPLGHTPLRQTAAVTVFHVEVVVGLGPVMAHEHLPHLHLLIAADTTVEPEATSGSLMVQCSRHVIPPVVEVRLTDQRAHDLGVGLQCPAQQSADLLAARDQPHCFSARGGRPPLALRRTEFTRVNVRDARPEDRRTSPTPPPGRTKPAPDRRGTPAVKLTPEASCGQCAPHAGPLSVPLGGRPRTRSRVITLKEVLYARHSRSRRVELSHRPYHVGSRPSSEDRSHRPTGRQGARVGGGRG